MPKLPLTVEKEIPLNLPIDENPEQDAFAKIRLATIDEEEIVSDLTRRIARTYNQDGSQTVQLQYSNLALRRLQAYSTMTDCNLMDQDGKFLFKFARVDGVMRSAMTQAEFNAAWGKLPASWASRIVLAVFEVNPSWNPANQGF